MEKFDLGEVKKFYEREFEEFLKELFFLPPNRGPPHRPTDDEPAVVQLHPFSYFVLWFFSGKCTSLYHINSTTAVGSKQTCHLLNQ